MGVIAYAISGDVQGNGIIGVQPLTGYMWLFENPQLSKFSSEPGLEYHVIYRTCYLFMVNEYFAFIGTDEMKLHLPGSGLFDDQQTFGGICKRDYRHNTGGLVDNIHPLNATFSDSSNTQYPSSTPQNRTDYLTPPNKISFYNLEFKNHSANNNFAIGANIDLDRVEESSNDEDTLPPPKIISITQT